MSQSTTLQPKADAAANKTCSTRLLDLLAGWASYVDEDERNGISDPLLSAEEIGALYQEAGTMESADLQTEEHAVRLFIEHAFSQPY